MYFVQIITFFEDFKEIFYHKSDENFLLDFSQHRL